MLYDKETKELCFDNDADCRINDITTLWTYRYHKDKKPLTRIRVSIPKVEALELRENYHVANVKNIGDDYFFFANIPKDCIKIRDSNGQEIECTDILATAHGILSGGGIWDTLLCARFKLMQITDTIKNISYPIISLKELSIII